ncbi:MAG: sugar phosphate isomerase/epimerase [Oscillospiraceae bacterium]|nr:sugar phosphate isomerase/epimerase [Oscillospiraceae bacterium]
MGKLNIGMQIYTLRDEISRGYDEVFKQIADIGYKSVEMTYNPGDGEEVGRLLKKHGLIATGAHIGVEAVENDIETVVKFMDNIGADYIIIPWIADDVISTLEKTVETAKRFEAAAKKVAALNNGMELGFHNHTIEFARKFDGKTVMDIFFEEAPTLKFQVDAGWACAAGVDVIEALTKLGPRLRCIHIKDVDENNAPTEIGSGKADMKSVIETAAKLGVEWGIVEQDSCVNYKPFESVKISYDYIRTIN